MTELRAIEGERLDERKPLSALAFTADVLAPIPVPRRIWHVDGLIPSRTVTLLSGDGGIGKSTLALQLCCATAVGDKWLGFRTRPGRALYLSCEDDGDELHRRLELIALHYKLGLEELTEVRLLPLADQDALLALGEPGRALEPTPLWHEFRADVANWRPHLIVIDSLADVFGANENDRAHVRAFVRMLRSLAIEDEAAVVILGHPSLAGLMNGSGMSGSTAWHNSVRSRLYLTGPPTDHEAAVAADIRLLQVKKSNYGPAGADLRVRYWSGAFVLDDPTQANPLDRALAADRADSLFLELLDAFEASGRIVSDSTGRNYAPHLFANDPRGAAVTRKGFEASMNRLFGGRSIKMLEVGKGSHARRKIVRDDP